MIDDIDDVDGVAIVGVRVFSISELLRGGQCVDSAATQNLSSDFATIDLASFGRESFF